MKKIELNRIKACQLD